MDAPFDTALLDELMEQAELDVLLVTSKHNVQYLLGGHRFFWFDYMDAVGVSRYLPVVGYYRGEPGKSFFVANEIEFYQLDHNPVWVPDVETSSWGIQDAVGSALQRLRDRGGRLRVGIEPSFLPMEGADLLRAEPSISVHGAELVLDRLRARKSPAEIELVDEAAERIVAAMGGLFDAARPGMTKNELLQILRVEEARRELTFEYALLTVGSSLGRGPSDEVLEEGDIISVDSGGNYRGYIGDLARMAIVGEPDQELVDLLAEVEAIQQAARVPIRPGALGQEVYDSVADVMARSPHRAYTSFVTHGMGLVSHEVPRLTDSGPVPYPNLDGPLPLQEGYVLSIETTISHPTRGFIKLEDTVIVTADGHRGAGDGLRGWNICGRGAHLDAGRDD